jgi:hypothetical protein
VQSHQQRPKVIANRSIKHMDERRVKSVSGTIRCVLSAVGLGLGKRLVPFCEKIASPKQRDYIDLLAYMFNTGCSFCS